MIETIRIAWPTFAAQVFSAVAITWLAYQKKHDIHYESKYIFRWDSNLLKCILRVAVPNGFGEAIFQFVKVALSSIVALFGTYRIAANGVAQSIWSSKFEPQNKEDGFQQTQK